MYNRKRKNEAGNRYNSLVVLSDADPYITPSGRQRRRVWVKCDCNRTKLVHLSSLRSGNTKSCGCATNSTHNQSLELLYPTWNDMIQRTTNPNHPRYATTGGKGIKVCKEWQDVNVFLEDIGDKPSDNHSLTRIDINGDYSPTNCKWDTTKNANRNQSTTKLNAELVATLKGYIANGEHLAYKTKKAFASHLSSKLGINTNTIANVFYNVTWKDIQPNLSAKLKA